MSALFEQQQILASLCCNVISEIRHRESVHRAKCGGWGGCEHQPVSPRYCHYENENHTFWQNALTSFFKEKQTSFLCGSNFHFHIIFFLSSLHFDKIIIIIITIVKMQNVWSKQRKKNIVFVNLHQIVKKIITNSKEVLWKLKILCFSGC